MPVWGGECDRHRRLRIIHPHVHPARLPVIRHLEIPILHSRARQLLLHNIRLLRNLKHQRCLHRLNSIHILIFTMVLMDLFTAEGHVGVEEAMVVRGATDLKEVKEADEAKIAKVVKEELHHGTDQPRKEGK